MKADDLKHIIADCLRHLNLMHLFEKSDIKYSIQEETGGQLTTQSQITTTVKILKNDLIIARWDMTYRMADTEEFARSTCYESVLCIFLYHGIPATALALENALKEGKGFTINVTTNE